MVTEVIDDARLCGSYSRKQLSSVTCHVSVQATLGHVPERESNYQTAQDH
jgi:hypothetical protein